MKKSLLILNLIASIAILKAQTWSVDSLPNRGFWDVAAISDNKMVVLSDSAVNIYDNLTQTWKTDVPSFRGGSVRPLLMGNKVYFVKNLSAPDLLDVNARSFDIYDIATNTFKRDTMPFMPSSAGTGVIGSKLFIAGGFEIVPTGRTIINTIRIFDTLTQSWLYTGGLSVARLLPQVVKVKNKILFIGGYINTNSPNWTFFSDIDIYDATSGQWSTIQMQNRRLSPVTAVSGSKVMIAGGIDGLTPYGGSYIGHYSNAVEIYDVDKNTWQTADFPKARIFRSIGVYSDKAYIMCGGFQDLTNPQAPYDKIDVYNFSSNTWSSQPFPYPEHVRIGVTTAIKNKILFVGGQSPDGKISSRIDIMTLPPNRVLDPTVLPNKLSIAPNPVSDVLTFDFDKEDTPQYALKITNALGQSVYNQEAMEEPKGQIDVQNWLPGLYLLTIQTAKRVKSQTFIKQ